MDIAKYIGLFLLKNHFCYIHGLGNMELNKKPAIHDGKALQSPSYEIVVTPGGSIDDNLANFIATNEQISISKAANALRDYSIRARKDMAEGKDVVIPNMGKFVEENGKVKFITDENFRFTPAGIPTIRNSKQLEEQNSKPAHKPSYPPPQKANSVNWSMVILAAVLLIILAGGAYGIYYYTVGSSQPKTAPAPPVVKDTVVPVAAPPPVDTTHVKDSLAATLTMPVDSSTVGSFKMVIGNYKTRERADKRAANLKLNGTHADVIQRDSVNNLVLVTVNCKVYDTARFKDSLVRMFGFKDVVIYK